MDITDCEQVDPALYEAISRAVPANCRIRWSVPLTDGRFPCDSDSLTLPRFSPEDAANLPYFENLSALDASGSTAYEALLALSVDRPDLALTFTLPVGDQVLTAADESIAVTGEPDVALLERMLIAFPALRTLDLTEASVDPAAAFSLATRYPALAVLYTVPVGSLRFPPEAETIDLANSGIQDAQELLNSLPYLPALQAVDLHGTALTLEDLCDILAVRPDLALSHRVKLLGQEAGTEGVLRQGVGPVDKPGLLRPARHTGEIPLHRPGKKGDNEE